MKLYYDFHIHSCLSPCANDDMTPNNIVGMAQLKGLDAIAVTDHNACGNLPSVLACAREAGLLVIPGMELETREEVHMLCLFASPDALFDFARLVDSRMPPIQNRKEIFGNQLLLDAEDNLVGEKDNLLITACELSMEEAVDACRSHGGVILPAHVDRDANSMVTNLGFIPPELAFPAIELSTRTTETDFLGKYPMYAGYRVLQNSDAHYLGDISEREHFLLAEEKTAEAVLAGLLGKN